MKINVQREYQISKTFRTEKVASMFDVPIEEKFKKKWEIDLPIEEKKWQIGLIIGHSGSGKTTIAKQLFKGAYLEGYNWGSNNSVLDDFDSDLDSKDITDALSRVGFSSPPHWMLPFNSLSNGQKFRVELARALLDKKDKLVIDEFTSLVDRDVAKISCVAVSKAIRKTKKQVVAVTCHEDISEWLEPDWIYNVSTQTFEWSLLRRPQIDVQLFEVSHTAWPLFREHHYLSANINVSAKCYAAFWNDNPVGFAAVLHFPHPRIKNMKRGHRVVILPDFQGVGLGNRLSEFVAQIYHDKGFRYVTTTSHPAMIHYRAKSKKWRMTQKIKSRSVPKNSLLVKKKGHERLTASFEYLGIKKEG